MSDRLDEISKTRYTWQNVIGNVRTTPLRYFYPEDIKDIQEIVLEAEKRKYRVRAVGSGHSFSEAAKGDEFLMDMKALRHVQIYEYPYVKAELSDRKYALVDAGTTIRRMNRELDKRKLSLMNMGVVDFQTVSGALMTGTHGTGIKEPAFPDMVRAIRIVGHNARKLQIEPKDGITDPVYHKAHSDFELIQDDDIFYSTVLSFGAMGIVYQIVLEVKPLFYMREERYLKNWSEVKAMLQDGRFMKLVNLNDFVAFRTNPHEIDSDHLCSIIVQNKIKDNPSPVKQGMRNLLSAFGGNLEFIVEGMIRTANWRPELTPKKLQASMRLMKYKHHTEKSYKLLFQGGASALRYGISSEFAFKADPALLITVMEKIFEETKHFASYARIYHPSYVPVRFTQQSNAYLSTANRYPAMYIDIITLYGTLGYADFLEAYQEKMIALGGVPHWGKMNNVLYQKHNVIHEHFPLYQKWKDVRKKMDPEGTFLNDFVIRMGLS